MWRSPERLRSPAAPSTSAGGRAPSRKGFTLIELLIVVIIIGLLAAIAIPQFQSVRLKSYRSTLMTDLKNLAITQEIYHTSNFTFSADLTALGAAQSDGVTITVNEATNTGWAATAVHSGAAGEQCGLYHGNAAPAGGSPATVESVVTCSF